MAFEYVKDKQAASIWIESPTKYTSFDIKGAHPSER
jgi:hypothetical protein